MQFSISLEGREHDASFESVIRCRFNQAFAKYSRRFRKSSMRVYQPDSEIEFYCLLELTAHDGETLQAEQSATTELDAVNKTIKVAAAMVKEFALKLHAEKTNRRNEDRGWAKLWDSN